MINKAKGPNLNSNLIKKLKNIVEKACKQDENVLGYGIWTHHIKPMIPIGKKLAELTNADKEIVTIAIILHDYASIKNQKYRTNHHKYGAELAKEILMRQNYPLEKIDRVQKCILNHRGSRNKLKQSAEERCVADADAIMHMKEIPSLLFFAYQKRGLSIDEGREWLRKKIERDWKKLSDVGKKYAEPFYKAAKMLISK